MKESLALVAYGLLLLSGAFMTIFWGRLAVKRLQTIDHQWLDDRYAILAICLTLSAVGTSVFFGARAYGFMVHKITTVSQGGIIPILILIGLFTIAISKAGFVWAATLDQRPTVWRLFLALSVLWVIIAAIWVWFDPFRTYPYL